MEKQNRTHVQVLLPEIMAMMAEEKTRRAEGQAVKRLLERERRKGRKLETEILPRPKGRPGEAAQVCTLAQLRELETDMFTTVFVGNSQTRALGGHMVTPRGYRL